MSDFSVDLNGRTALVTGAGAGCGRAIACALALNGTSVAVADINIERAEATVEDIERCGGGAIALHADVSNRFQAANMIERARDAFGSIQILVNACRVFHAESMLSIDEWDWRRQLEVNITGAFFCLQLVGRVMADEGGGSIINLTSAAALQSTLPAGLSYIAGGAALIGMTRQAARELRAHNIRVNAIAAGNTRPAQTASSRAQVELDRAGASWEGVANAAVYLCSDAARSISGQVLVVDGGVFLSA